MSTQIFLAREDVFDALTMAMGAAPPEASAALSVYYTLSEAPSGGRPTYLAAMKKPDALANIKSLTVNPKMSAEDKTIAEKLYEHLNSE